MTLGASAGASTYTGADTRVLGADTRVPGDQNTPQPVPPPEPSQDQGGASFGKQAYTGEQYASPLPQPYMTDYGNVYNISEPGGPPSPIPPPEIQYGDQPYGRGWTFDEHGRQGAPGDRESVANELRNAPVLGGSFSMLGDMLGQMVRQPAELLARPDTGLAPAAEAGQALLDFKDAGLRAFNPLNEKERTQKAEDMATSLATALVKGQEAAGNPSVVGDYAAATSRGAQMMAKTAFDALGIPFMVGVSGVERGTGKIGNILADVTGNPSFRQGLFSSQAEQEAMENFRASQPKDIQEKIDAYRESTWFSGDKTHLSGAQAIANGMDPKQAAEQFQDLGRELALQMMVDPMRIVGAEVHAAGLDTKSLVRNGIKQRYFTQAVEDMDGAIERLRAMGDDRVSGISLKPIARDAQANIVRDANAVLGQLVPKGADGETIANALEDFMKGAPGREQDIRALANSQAGHDVRALVRTMSQNQVPELSEEVVGKLPTKVQEFIARSRTNDLSDEQIYNKLRQGPKDFVDAHSPIGEYNPDVLRAGLSGKNAAQASAWMLDHLNAAANSLIYEAPPNAASNILGIAKRIAHYGYISLTPATLGHKIINDVEGMLADRLFNAQPMEHILQNLDKYNFPVEQTAGFHAMGYERRGEVLAPAPKTAFQMITRPDLSLSEKIKQAPKVFENLLTDVTHNYRARIIEKGMSDDILNRSKLFMDRLIDKHPEFGQLPPEIRNYAASELRGDLSQGNVERVRREITEMGRQVPPPPPAASTPPRPGEPTPPPTEPSPPLPSRAGDNLGIDPAVLSETERAGARAVRELELMPGVSDMVKEVEQAHTNLSEVDYLRDRMAAMHEQLAHRAELAQQTDWEKSWRPEPVAEPKGAPPRSAQNFEDKFGDYKDSVIQSAINSPDQPKFLRDLQRLENDKHQIWSTIYYDQVDQARQLFEQAKASGELPKSEINRFYDNWQKIARTGARQAEEYALVRAQQMYEVHNGSGLDGPMDMYGRDTIRARELGNGGIIRGSERDLAIRDALNKKLGEFAKPTPEETQARLSQDRRADDYLRKHVEDMSPTEKNEAIVTLRGKLQTDELTGLGNIRAYQAAEKKPFQLHSDVDSLKWVNDNMGHQAGDELLRAMSQAMKEEGIEAYHISGDEFWGQFNSQEQADAAMKALSDRFNDATITFTDANGKVYTKKGFGFSYGIANDGEGAELALSRNKSEREAIGLRAPRGERPPGVVDTLAEKSRGEPGRGPVEGGAPAPQTVEQARQPVAVEKTPTGGVRLPSVKDVLDEARGQGITISEKGVGEQSHLINALNKYAEPGSERFTIKNLDSRTDEAIAALKRRAEEKYKLETLPERDKLEGRISREIPNAKTGMTKSQEEFVLDRMADGAREIDVPLDGKIILHSDEQAELLKVRLETHQGIPSSVISERKFFDPHPEANKAMQIYGSPTNAIAKLRSQMEAVGDTLTQAQRGHALKTIAELERREKGITLSHIIGVDTLPYDVERESQALGINKKDVLAVMSPERAQKVVSGLEGVPPRFMSDSVRAEFEQAQEVLRREAARPKSVWDGVEPTSPATTTFESSVPEMVLDSTGQPQKFDRAAHISRLSRNNETAITALADAQYPTENTFLVDPSTGRRMYAETSIGGERAWGNDQFAFVGKKPPKWMGEISPSKQPTVPIGDSVKNIEQGVVVGGLRTNRGVDSVVIASPTSDLVATIPAEAYKIAQREYPGAKFFVSEGETTGKPIVVVVDPATFDFKGFILSRDVSETDKAIRRWGLGNGVLDPTADAVGVKDMTIPTRPTDAPHAPTVHEDMDRVFDARGRHEVLGDTAEVATQHRAAVDSHSKADLRMQVDHAYANGLIDRDARDLYLKKIEDGERVALPNSTTHEAHAETPEDIRLRGERVDRGITAIQNDMGSRQPPSGVTPMGNVPGDFWDRLGSAMHDQAASDRLLAGRTGVKLAERTIPDGPLSHLDRALDWVQPFHYWFTRNARNWSWRMLDHPEFLSSYIRYQDALEKQNRDAGYPEKFKHSIQTGFFGTPLYMDLAKTLFPLDRLTESYPIMDKSNNAIVQLFGNAGKVGINPWFPFRWLAALTQRESDPVAFRELVGHDIPGSYWVKELTANMRQNGVNPFGVIPPGGVYMEGALFKELGSGDIGEKSRIGKSLYQMYADGVVNPETNKPVTLDEVKRAAFYQQGKLWDAATQQAAVRADPNAALRYVGAKGMTFYDNIEKNTDEARDKWNKIFQDKTLTPDDVKAQLKQFSQDYPWFNTMQMSAKGNHDQDALFYSDVLGRLPPGSKTSSYKENGVEDIVKGFFAASGSKGKGDYLAGLSDTDRAKFSDFIKKMDQQHGTPSPGTSAEWDRVRELQAEYFRLPDAASKAAFKTANPLLGEYMQSGPVEKLWETWYGLDSVGKKLALAQPQLKGLSLYIDKGTRGFIKDDAVAGLSAALEKYANGLKANPSYQEYVNGAAAFGGADIHDKQNKYYDLKAKDPAAAKAFLKENQDLKDYWGWRDNFLNLHPDLKVAMSGRGTAPVSGAGGQVSGVGGGGYAPQTTGYGGGTNVQNAIAQYAPSKSSLFSSKAEQDAVMEAVKHLQIIGREFSGRGGGGGGGGGPALSPRGQNLFNLVHQKYAPQMDPNTFMQKVIAAMRYPQGQGQYQGPIYGMHRPIPTLAYYKSQEAGAGGGTQGTRAFAPPAYKSREPRHVGQFTNR